MLGISWTGGSNLQGLAEVWQGLGGALLVFQGQAQEKCTSKRWGKAASSSVKGRQGQQGRGIQGRDLGQVENDRGVAGAIQEMGAGDQHIDRGRLRSGCVVFTTRTSSPRRDRAPGRARSRP